MNQNENHTSKNTFKKLTHFIIEWIAKQGKKKLLLCLVGLTGYAGLFYLWSKFIEVSPVLHPKLIAWASALATFGFLTAWFYVCFGRKTISNGRSISAKKFLLICTVTALMSVFAACSTESAHANQTKPAITQTQTNIAPCELIIAIFILLIGGFILYQLYKLLCHLGFCGPTNTPPPNSPPPGTNSVQSRLIGPNGLPVTIFYFQNGILSSNSTGRSVLSQFPLLSLNGVNIPSGSSISTPTVGISDPPSLGVWQETGNYADSNLDPTHPYTIVLNYTMLTSTNIALQPWHELYTAVAWVNNNQAAPLICTVFYTNGLPSATNWIQSNMSALTMGTGTETGTITVYGSLAQFGNVTSTSAMSVAKAVAKGVPAPPPIPPGGPGYTQTNGVVIPSYGQFFKLTCSTNAVKTSWP